MATERSLSSVTRQHNIKKLVRGMNIYPDWEGENGKTIWAEKLEDSVLQISLEPHNTVV